LPPCKKNDREPGADAQNVVEDDGSGWGNLLVTLSLQYHQPIDFFYRQLTIPQVQVYADLLHNHFMAQREAMENAQRQQQMASGFGNKQKYMH
jgi:hypothetical protein